MRFLRWFTALLATAVVFATVAIDLPYANAQSVSDAEGDAADAKTKVDQAEGLIDSAVEERETIELQLAEAISRLNDLSAQLSVVGSKVDRTAKQLGFADVELSGIQDQIEVQAVDAYMTVLSSPTVSLVNSASVEKALVASNVVEGVVSAGRASVDELLVKRRSLEDLQAAYLADEDEFQSLQEQVSLELANLESLYDRADRALADAIREAQVADSEYRAALSAVDLARAREEENRRQEERTTTTTSPPATSPPTTTPPTTGGTSPTTTSPGNTTTTTGGGGGPWNHPPQVEQWRPLVQTHFPSSRVEEALRIIDCESNGDPNAYNPYSGASGLFQFLPSTWASTAPQAGYGGYSVFDPEANVASAAWLGNRYEQLGLYFWQAWSCRRVLN